MRGFRDAGDPRRAGARPRHRRGRPADLPDVDLRPGRRRRHPRGGYEYSRSANPTRTALETCLAALEGGRHGLAFASGWPRPTRCCAVCCARATTSSSPHDAYGGTFRLVAKVLEPWGLECTRGRPAPTSTRCAPRCVRARPELIWCETPTNPLLGIADIAAIAAIAHDAGALLVVDNTFASPYLQQPARARRRRRRALDDEVPRRPLRRRRRRARRRPTTSSRRSWRSPERDGRDRRARSTRGSCCAGSRRSPCGWSATATTPSGSSSCCSGIPRWPRCYYPGLPSTPGHDVAARQMRRFGGMVSFRCAAGSRPALAVCARHAAVHAGRVARRRRVADRAPGAG